MATSTFCRSEAISGDMNVAPRLLSHSTTVLKELHLTTEPVGHPPTTKSEAVAARRATKWKMSASAKTNLPHVAIYYANIINIIYSLCEKLKKKNLALGSRFFFFWRRWVERESPLGVTQSLAFFGQAASDSWRNARGGGRVNLPHFSHCPCLLIVAK